MYMRTCALSTKEKKELENTFLSTLDVHVNNDIIELANTRWKRK